MSLLPLSLFAQIDHQLVAFYPLDGSGVELVAGNDGALFGTTPATDRFGNPVAALHFDGSSDHVEISPVPTNSSADMTVSFWVRPTMLPQQGFAVNYGFDDGLTGDGFALRIADGSTGGAWNSGDRLQLIHCGQTFLDGGLDIVDTIQWMHLVMMRDAAATKIYVNSVFVASYSDPFSMPTGPWSIGSANSIRHFAGDIDEVRIYDRAMSQPGVDSLFNALDHTGVGGTSSSPVSVTVRPVPVDDQLTIDTADPSAFARIELKDPLGRTMRTMLPTQRVLDLSGSAPGVYLLHFVARNGAITMVRFVKQ